MKENRDLPNAQQDILPLTGKAEKLIADYNQATGSSICVYDRDCNLHFIKGAGCCPEINICPYCKYSAGESGENNCSNMHAAAVNEAKKRGSYRVYQCRMGLLFWTSPVYAEGGFSGSLRGGGFRAQSRTNAEVQPPAGKKTVDIFSNAIDTSVMCNKEITKNEFMERIKQLPEADRDKVQSLAEMIQLCAESISTGSADYHEIIRRRNEQQEAISKIIDELKSRYGDDPGQSEKCGYPLEKEKLMLASLRKGDAAEAKKLLNELLAMLFYAKAGQFKFIQLRVIELVVLISRIEVVPGRSGNLSMEINSQSLKFVQEAKTLEELTDILHLSADRVSGTISSFRGIPHAAALRKAENFILENYTRKISLKEIADIAGLSPPYFSTIFKEEMGENLSKYLNRLRVEKASHLLLETDMSLSEIAANCCFEDQSWFSKIFKAYTGISPGKYRNQGGR